MLIVTSALDYALYSVR